MRAAAYPAAKGVRAAELVAAEAAKLVATELVRAVHCPERVRVVEERQSPA